MEYVLNRTRTVLRLYYEPDMEPDERAAMIDEFRRALGSLPKWAVSRAFDDWVRQHNRRPSPGEVAILAKGHLKRIGDELDYRNRNKPSPERKTVDPATAKEILEQADFTPRRFGAMQKSPMATTFAEAEEGAARSKRLHWTHTASERDLADLAKARASNALMQGGEK